jgi:hypothetical protein
MLTWMRPVAVRCQRRDWRAADVAGGAVSTTALNIAKQSTFRCHSNVSA